MGRAGALCATSRVIQFRSAQAIAARFVLPFPPLEARDRACFDAAPKTTARSTRFALRRADQAVSILGACGDLVFAVPLAGLAKAYSPPAASLSDPARLGESLASTARSHASLRRYRSSGDPMQPARESLRAPRAS